MKKFTLAITFTFLSLICNAVEIDKLSDEHLSHVKNIEYTGKNAVNFVKDYIGVYSEGKSDYLYNTKTEDLVALFKSGINSAEMVEIVKTSGMTNVFFLINEEVLVHTSYKNDTGEMYLCRFEENKDIKDNE